MIFIKNGTINTITNGIIKGDILIENKKIKAITQKTTTRQWETSNARFVHIAYQPRP